MRLYKAIRLFVRLISSYIKSHWKLFFLGLVLGLAILSVIPKIPWIDRTPTIGQVGNYSLSNLPLDIQNEISFGLTKISSDGRIVPGAAKSWEFSDNGKVVTFYLDTTLTWQDKKPFTSGTVNYNLKSIQLSRPSSDQIRLTLKEPFAPLLTVVSQPLFKDGIVGLGKYRAKAINFNGRFISSLTLVNLENNQSKTYRFFVNDQTLLTALKLGLVRQAKNIHSTFGLENDSHYQIESTVSASTIATLFYNTERQSLEEKTIRQALTYLLPDQYDAGEAANSPVAKNSWVSTPLAKKYPQNLALAKKTLDKFATSSSKLKLNLVSNSQLEETAKIIVSQWQNTGISTSLEVTNVTTPDYDAYLAYLEIPIDPDQYLLWHSTQLGNISHYNSPKVDKLLEDGRKTLVENERKDIYANFQKAITEDAPAAFLYYPKLYTVTRK